MEIWGQFSVEINTPRFKSESVAGLTGFALSQTSRRYRRGDDHDASGSLRHRGQGTQRSAVRRSPVPIDEAQVAPILAAAVDWFAALFEVIGPSLKDRENKLAVTPSVLAALGAMGHQLVEITNRPNGRLRQGKLARGLTRREVGPVQALGRLRRQVHAKGHVHHRRGRRRRMRSVRRLRTKTTRGPRRYARMHPDRFGMSYSVHSLMCPFALLSASSINN